MISRMTCTSLALAGTMAAASAVYAATPDDSIGLFTAVHGKVMVERSASTHVSPVSVRDDVFFQDVIETKHKSRTKAFFDDETILTVGENSRVTVNEHVYNPELDVRRVVVKLLVGKLRALVGKAFTGAGSKFEIHTPTAIAAARGTYFIVWVEDSGTSGIVNIGEAGKVDFTSGGKTVTVSPGEFSVAPAGKPPAMPVILKAGSESDATGQSIAGVRAGTALASASNLTGTVGNTLGNTLSLANNTLNAALGTVNALTSASLGQVADVLDAINGTDLKDAPAHETPQQVVQSLGLSIPTQLTSSQVADPTGIQSAVLDSNAADDLASLEQVEELANKVLSSTSIASSPVAAPVGTIASTVGSIVLVPPAVTSGIVNPVAPVVPPVVPPVAPPAPPAPPPVVPPIVPPIIP